MEDNVKKIGEALSKSIIHFDPNRTVYAVSETELDNINSHGNSIWKDVGIAALAMGIPCLINTVSLIINSKIPDGQKFVASLDIFLNSLFGLVGLILGIVFLLIWNKSRKKKVEIIDLIKQREKYEL